MTNNFKYTVEEIFEISESTVRAIKTVELTETQRGFLLADLLEVCGEFMNNKCKRFKRKNESLSLEVEDLYSMAVSTSLMKALQGYKLTDTNRFFQYWLTTVEHDLINAGVKDRSKKEKFNSQDYMKSTDEVMGEGDTTILNYIPDDYNLEEEVCGKMLLNSLLDEFESKYKYGALIRCEAIQGREEKTKAILKILKADTYGSKERGKVCEAKKLFKNFLARKNISYLDLI